MSSVDESDERAPRIREPAEAAYNERQRLKEIWDERRELMGTRRMLALRKSPDPGLFPEAIDPQTASKIYHDALKNYLLVIRTLFTHVFPDIGKEYWEDKDLGTHSVHPPKALISPRNGRVENPPGTATYGFNGLESIVEAPSPLTTAFTAELWSRSGGNHTANEVVRSAVPWEILDTALGEANEFLAEVGLEADLDEGEHHGRT